MYFDGTKEVTKQDIRNIYKEELTRQGAKEMWTLRPHDFEERESCPTIIIVTNNDFDTSRLDACYDDKDVTLYLDSYVTNNISKMRRIFRDPVCVFREGEWLDAN